MPPRVGQTFGTVGTTAFRIGASLGRTYAVFAIGGMFATGSALGQDLFVGAYGDSAVHRYSGTTGAPLGLCVSTPTVPLPGQIAIGPDGMLWVSSHSTGGVFRYDPQSCTSLGLFVDSSDGAPGTGGNGVMAFTPSGDLLVAAYTSNTVRRYNGSTWSTFAIDNNLRDPSGMVWRSNGNLLVASNDNGRVMEFDGTTGEYVRDFVAPGAGGLVNPVGLALGGADGNLYVTDGNVDQHKVRRYDRHTGAYINDFIDDATHLAGSVWIVFGPNGNAFVSNQNNSQIVEYSRTSGAFVRVIVPAGSDGLSYPGAILFWPCPSLQLVDQPTPAASCATGTSSFSVTVAGTGPFTYQWQWALPAPPSQAPAWNDLVLGVNSINGHTAFTCTTDDTLGGRADVGNGAAGRYLFHVIATDTCGSITSDAATWFINSADFNHDGDLGTDADIAAFFACLSGNCCPTCGSADFNGDGDVGTDADIESFFRVLGGGPC